jgi:hypothetical protein
MRKILFLFYTCNIEADPVPTHWEMKDKEREKRRRDGGHKDGGCRKLYI